MHSEYNEDLGKRMFLRREERGVLKNSYNPAFFFRNLRRKLLNESSSKSLPNSIDNNYKGIYEENFFIVCILKTQPSK